MPQSIAHCGEFPDGEIEFIRLAHEHRAINLKFSVRRKHSRDLLERKTRGATQCNECQSLEHLGIVLATQAVTTHRRHETLFLVKAQRRRRDPGPLRDLADVQITHRLTSS